MHSLNRYDRKEEDNNLIKMKPMKHVTFFKYNFIDLEEDELDFYNINLKLFEIKLQQKYPFGLDYFTIDYGNNHFTFFKRLGNIHYIIIQHIEKKFIVGTVCVILRKYPHRDQDMQNNEILFWYLCDLKIDINHRGQNLTIKLFKHIIDKYMRKYCRGYLITMNPDSQHFFHIFNNMNKYISLKFTHTKLLIYSVPINIMREIEKYFTCVYNDISYLSLAGTKDLILTSTNKSMELYHLQHSIFASKNGVKKLNELPENAIIMFCFPKNSPFQIIFDNLNIKTKFTASIISWGMNFFDWHNILTSDI